MQEFSARSRLSAQVTDQVAAEIGFQWWIYHGPVKANGRCLDLFAPGVNAEARKVGSGHWVDAAAVDPAAGRRQTGQGRDNIVPYLFSQMSQRGNFL